jgi:TolB-like protein/DNA-binding winged helix-turn-helix (wHTH) protein
LTDQKQQQNRVFGAGDWRVDGNSLTVSRAGESRPIEPKAYQVLRYLAERPGVLVTIDELMDTQWDGAVVTPNAVSRVIAQIRKTLDDDAKNPRYVQTVARNGYRFVAVPTDAATPQVAIVQRRWWLPLAAAAMALVVVWYMWPKQATEPSIAVLPFNNMTGSDNWDYVGDGVAEEVINSLSRIPELKVRPQLQSFRYRDSQELLAEIAAELDVRYLVTGSVRTSGQNMRLAAQLIDPVSGQNLASITEEYGALELFEGQDAVSQAVAAVVLDAAGLSATELAPAINKPNPEAYDLYLKGRHIWHRRGNQPLQGAIDNFHAAVQLDPDFARGWAALATAYLTYPNYSPRGFATWNDAEPAAQKALELDPDIAEAYCVLGTFAQTRFEWQDAEELFLEALRRDPQSVNANYWYAELLINTGKHERSIPYVLRTMELDPTYRPPQMTLAIEHMYFADAEASTEQMVALWRNGFESRVSFMLTFIAFYYTGDAVALDDWLSTGELEAAERALLQRFIDAELRGQIDATLVAEIAEHYWRRPDYVFGYWMLGHLGAHDRVFEMLNFRLDNGWQVDMRPFWTPDFETRQQPEFVALLNRVGLLDYWDTSEWGSICLQADDGMDCSGVRMTPERLNGLLEADSVR